MSFEEFNFVKESEKLIKKIEFRQLNEIKRCIISLLNEMREEYGPNKSLNYAAAEEFVNRLLKRL